MFAFGLKGRTGEVIKRGAQALFIGDYIDVKMITESELNEEAQAGLYFYAAANCLYDLYLQMKMSRCGDDNWATISFFMDNALDGIEAYERSCNLAKGSWGAQCLPLVAKIGAYAMERGVYPDLTSAKEVEQLDDEVDVEEARKLIV